MSVIGLTAPAGASSHAPLAGTLGSVISVTSDNNSGSTCALLSTGHVDCWGYGGDGELGNGTTANSDVPVAVTGIATATAVAEDSDGGGGGGSFCALLKTGQLKCWGYNGDGELGNGTTTNYTVPVVVKNITTATAVVGGDYGFCALLSTSHLDCWGYGAYGELGDGSTASSDVPVAVRVISNAAKVVSGYYGYCALLPTSHVDCWGYGDDGELGNGTTASSDVPVAVTGITSASGLTADTGNASYCVLLSTSHVKCWGYNYDGELGNGTTTDSDVPVAVLNIGNATSVIQDANGGGSGGSVCALLSTSHLDCWGYNEDGELGNGTTTNYAVPVPVKKVTTATAVIGGDYGFCALLSTSHLDCWGYGAYGELGDGATTSSDVPAAVRVISNATKVIGGNYGYCALLSTAHVDCWGYGGDGELGHGSTSSSDVPVAVLAAG